MAFNVSFNGTTYPLPSVGDRIYATYINTFLTAVANNALAKSGGTFTLTADVNFGASYGPVVAYIKSRSSNIASTGVFRLANDEGIAWRNAANSANLLLKLNSSNRLEVDGVAIPTISSTDTLTNKTISGSDNTITNIPLGTAITGTLPVANGGTGITAFGTGVATALGQNVTGSGSIVLGSGATLTSPAITTPTGIVKGDVGLGNVDNTSDATKNSATATLTNKTISGASNTITNVSLTSGVTGTLPIGNGGTGQTTANAALNALLPTQTSSANKYLKTDGTNTSWASASGGAGEINAILNASGADGTTGWTNVSVVSGSSSPLNPIITTAFSIANSAASETSTSGGYYAFTMPSGLLNRKLKVEFTFTTPATDVWRVSVYQGSTRVALSTDSSSVTTLPAAVTGGKFTAYFDTDSNTSWTLSVTRTSGSTGACVITNVIVGPGIQPQGAVVSEWQSFTPTGSWVSNVTYVGFYRRVGSSAEIKYKVLCSGAPTAASLSLNMPTGLTIDATVLPSTQGGATDLGTGTVLDSGSATYEAVPRYNGTNSSFDVAIEGAASTYVNHPALVSSTVPITFWSADEVNVTIEVPIAEWAGSGNVTLAQNDVEYASVGGTWDADSTTTVYGPAGSLMGGALSAARGKTITWSTPVQATDRIQLWGSKDQVNWFPLLGAELGPSNQPIVPSLTAAGTLVAGVDYRGGSSANQTIVVFRQYMQVANDDSPVTDWPSSAAYWVATKSSAGAAVGFGKATSVSTGLVAPRKGQYSLTVTGTNWTTVRAVGIYYQEQDGVPRFKFNIIGTLSSTATAFTGTISGVTFKAGSNLFQAVSASVQQDGTGIRTVIGSYVYPSASTFYVGSDAAMNRIMVSGDVELESIPTWA